MSNKKILYEAARVSELYKFKMGYVMAPYVLDLYFENLQLAIVKDTRQEGNMPGIITIRVPPQMFEESLAMLLRYAIAFAYCTGRSPTGKEFSAFNKMQVLPTWEQRKDMDKWIMKYAKAKARK